MNEELNNLRIELEELKSWKRSLERSSSIPLAIDQAFRERFKSKIVTIKAILNFGEVAAQSSADLTVSLGGAKINDPVVVSGNDAISSGIILTGRVATANVVTVTCNNFSAGAINPASAEFNIAILT